MDSKNVENESDNEPLTKPKKDRSQKQIEAFEKARVARAQYLEEKKKQTEPTLKERKQVLNKVKKELEGKTEKPEESDEEIILPETKKEIKKVPGEARRDAVAENKTENIVIPTKKGTKIIKPAKQSEPEPEEHSDTEVEEEVIYIKKAPKKKKKKIVKKIIFENSDDEESDDEDSPAPVAPPAVAYASKSQPTSRETKSQQNAKSKQPPQGITVAKPSFQYYFMD